MLNLERIERAIIIVLASALLLGLGIVVYGKSKPPAALEIRTMERLDGLAARKEKVNINTSGVEEFVRLKGIGREMAQRIIDYRNSNGLFRTKDDVKKVKGIGQAKFDKIKDDISVE